MTPDEPKTWAPIAAFLALAAVLITKATSFLTGSPDGGGAGGAD